VATGVSCPVRQDQRTTKVPAGDLIAATTIYEGAIQHRIG